MSVYMWMTKTWKRKLILSLSLIILFFAMIVLSIWYLFHACFDKNPRFVTNIEKLSVIIPGEDLSKDSLETTRSREKKKQKIWRLIVFNALRDSGMTAVEMQQVYLKTQSVNLFSLDLGFLRRSIMADPEIRTAEIKRILPDHLIIKVNLRIPRVMLMSDESRYVCDNEGRIMERDSSEFAKGSLPVVRGIYRNFGVGKDIFDIVKPALELLNHLDQNRDFGLRAAIIDLADPAKQDIMRVTFFYRPIASGPEKKYVVEMPKTGIPTKIDELRATLETQASLNSDIIYIRLNFDGQAIIRTATPEPLSL